jgi:glycosyltransferase involved in cell wall biosynthesis
MLEPLLSDGPSMSDIVRVLYIHPFAAFGGATKSLAELVSALPAKEVVGTAIAPLGIACESLASSGLKVIAVRGIAQWDDTRFGHYRGVRWLILLRELVYWPATIASLRKAASLGPYDIIHCNEITALLVGVLAKRMLNSPLVVHVRSLQRVAVSGAMPRVLRRLLRTRADAIVAIDEAVRRTLPPDLPVEIIHNGLAIPTELPPRISADRFRVAIVGVLHRSKGVYELVEAARILRDRGLKVRILIVGQNIHSMHGLRGWLLRKLDFARDARAELEAYVAQHSLHDYVEFTGFVRDMPSIYQRIDAVCFPSHLDAPGRPVFEAALFGCPAIVAMRNPTTDVVVHGRTGLCIDEPTPMAIAAAIETLVRDPATAHEMGLEARRAAIQRFDSRICASKMLNLYRRVRLQSGGLPMPADPHQMPESRQSPTAQTPRPRNGRQ